MKLSLNYPQARHTNESLEEVSILWLKSLINISPDVLTDACRLHMEASDYFPTLKNLLECCRSVWEERRRNVISLPEPTQELSPEQVKENIANIRKAMNAPKPVTTVKGPDKSLQDVAREKLEKYKNESKKSS